MLRKVSTRFIYHSERTQQIYSFVPGPSSLLQFWPKRFGHFFPGSRLGVSRQTLSVKILFRLWNSSMEWSME